MLGLGALLVGYQGWKHVVQRFAVLSAALMLLLVLAVYLEGSAYLNGISSTTLARKTGTQVVINDHYTPTRVIILSSWDWARAILSFGVLALLMSVLVFRERRNATVLAVLLSASVLVLVEYVHLSCTHCIQQSCRLRGLVYVCGAGYALVRPAELAARWYVRFPLAAIAVAVTIAVGLHYTDSGVGGSRQDSPLYVLLRPYLALKSGQYLLGGELDCQMIYTEHINMAWYQ